MSLIPETLRYSKTHEWAQLDEEGTVKVGITDFAQAELGDLVFVELPELGRQVQAQEACAVVESVKTASDLHSPCSGEIVAINERLGDEPEVINEAPYDTWIFRIRPDDAGVLDQLLDADGYSAQIDE